MSAVRTVYVSSGAVGAVVRSAVDAWMKAEDRTLDVNVEFGDEYAGYETAVDVFGADESSTLDDARALAQGLTQVLPQCAVAVDVDLESAVAEPTAETG